MNDLYIDNLSDNKFEEYLVNLFENLGYDVERTPVSNNYGADLIISRDNEKTVVKGEIYSNTIEISSVQKIIEAKDYYQANKCLVVTNNYFTSRAIKLAKRNDVELWNRDDLIRKALVSVDLKTNKKTSNPRNEFNNNVLEDYEDELLSKSIHLVIDEQTGAEGINIDINIPSSSNDYEFNNKYKPKNKYRPKRDIRNKVLGIIFSLFLSFISLFICALSIKNAFIGALSTVVGTLLSFKLGFSLSDTVSNFNNKYK